MTIALNESYLERIPAVVSNEPYGAVWQNSKKVATQEQLFEKINSIPLGVKIGDVIEDATAHRILVTGVGGTLQEMPLTGGQSIRKNAIGTALEAYTPYGLPAQSGNSGKFLKTGGVTESWQNIAAADITSGTMATARLGSGTASGSTVLFGDQTYKNPLAIGQTIGNSPANGSVLFVGASALAQNNANLFWDNSNNRLGIGTSSPTQTLDVGNGTNSTLRVNTAANQGVYVTDGAALPGYLPSANFLFAVAGNDSGYVGLDLNARTSGATPFISMRRADVQRWTMTVDSSNQMNFRPGNAAATPKVTILPTGEVGIGETAPVVPLTVASTGDAQLRLGTTAASFASFDIGRNSTTGLLTFTGNQSGYEGFVFNGGGSEKFRIAASGYVGIGVGATAASKFQVNHAWGGSTLGLTGAILGLNNTDPGSGQSNLVFAFGGVAKGGIRGDFDGNFNYHGTGSQGFQFYHSIDTSVPAMGVSSSGLIIGGSAGATSSEKLEVIGNIKLSDGGNLVCGTSTGTKIGTSGSQKLGFFGATPKLCSGGWSVSNYNPRKTFNKATDTNSDFVDFTCTLASELLNLGLISA